MDNAPETGGSSKVIWLMLAGGLLMGLGLGVVMFGFNPPNAAPTGGSSLADAAQANAAAIIGGAAPDFTLQEAMSGDTITLSALQGQPVVINFWATWCGPCEVEMPDIEAAYQAHSDVGLVVLAVNAGEGQGAIEQFGTRLNLSFPLLMDTDEAVQRLYRVRAYPSTYFIDTNGDIAALQIGFMTASQLDENLDKILP